MNFKKNIPIVVSVIFGVMLMAFLAISQEMALSDITEELELSNSVVSDTKVKSYGRLKDITGLVTPVGSVLPYFGNEAPEGWLICDGQEYNREGIYSNLFLIMGTSCGAGDGASTFNVPDLRGKFIRGMNRDAAIDSDTSLRIPLKPGGNSGNKVGSYQDDAFQGHTHRFSYADRASSGGKRGIGWDSGRNRRAVHEPREYAHYGSPRLSKETRPKNVYVNFIIKY